METYYTVIAYILVLVFPCINGTTRLSLSIPIPSVKVDGILSLYCRIYDLGNKQLVTLSRTIGDSDDRERLTWGDYISRGVNDRTYLAIRHQSDGSVVHFLTIINVRQEEEGNYHCSIHDSNTLSEIDSVDVNVKIQHVPETNPICSPSTPLTINEGDMISLNCTSEAAVPEVNIKWSRTKDIPLSGSAILSSDGELRTLHYKARLSRDEDGAMFVCTVTSKAFPAYSKTCHIGPLKVISHPLLNLDTKIPQILKPSVTEKPIKQDIAQVRHSTDCTEYCSSLSSPTFYWVVATVIASSFAFLFIFLTAILIFRYYRSSKNRHCKEMQIYGGDEIYTELDSVPEGVRQVYMSLNKNPVQVGTECIPRKVGKEDKALYTVTAAFHPDANF